jgi:SAM-dependent methyltransferase
LPDATLTAGTRAADKVAGRRFWDANPCGGAWGDYRAFAEWIERTEPYAFDHLARHEWRGRRVLEVGCGQGVVLTWLASRGAQTVGVDMSTASIARTRDGARQLAVADRVRLAIADAETLPFPSESFDAVVSFGVLHHTPDTARSIEEVRRVLKPGGLAIVMLYRTGNPKWWMTSALRGVARLSDWWSGERGSLANRLRGDHRRDDSRGTALLELFGVPTLQAFSNRRAAAMFGRFTDVRVRNRQPGFRRLADVVPALGRVAPALSRIDAATERVWGFYQVIEARRAS